MKVFRTSVLGNNFCVQYTLNTRLEVSRLGVDEPLPGCLGLNPLSSRENEMPPHTHKITALTQKSYALEQAGEIGAALQLARQALERARAAGMPAELAAALVCTAHSLHHLGHYGEARDLAEEALTHAAPISRTRADALRILGSCAHETGNLEAAERFYHLSIDVARQLGYHRALQSCLHSLSACVYIPRGQFELALAADEEALRLALDRDMAEMVWFPLATMGWVYWVTGRRARALAIVEQMSHHVQPGSLAEGYYHCLRADLAQDGQDPDSAPELYRRARAIAETVGDPGLNAELRVGLSRYHRAAGNPSAAYDWADDALTIAQRAGNRDLQGWALIERARAAWEKDDLAAAESDLKAAIAVLRPMQANFDLARAYFFLAALLHQLLDKAQNGQRRAEAESAWLAAASRIVSGGYAFLLERERALAFPLLAAHLDSNAPDVANVSARLLTQLASVPPPPLRVHTLGRFEVWQGKRLIEEHAWRRRRAGELFRLLLVSPSWTISRDQVLEALWPNKSPASARSLFHQATSALRRVLEPDLPDRFPSRYLTVEAGQVALHLPTGSWVDFMIFEEHVKNRDWEAALALYQGDLFPGDLYADWAAAWREWLKQHAIRAALVVAREALAMGNPDEALSACHRALALEPWQEEAVLLGMQACVAQSDRAGALRLYLALERSLRKDLGIAPQEKVQRYYRSLLGK